MLKTFRPWNPKQGLLLPPSLMEWLPEGHLALFILEVVEELDLRAIYASYEGDLRGQPPYEPKMMVAVLLYAYATGVMSSRRIERKTQEDVAFRVLAANQSPDHSRIADFRRRHGSQFEQLFVQVLRLCQEAGLVKLGHVAIDGTKMKANASKHKAMSYERMQKEEARLREKVKMLLARAESVDTEEDALYGKRRRGDELPEELRRAETRLARIREAKKALEAEAKAAAEHQRNQDKEKDKDKDSGNNPPPVEDLPSHKVAHDADGTPTPKAQLAQLHALLTHALVPELVRLDVRPGWRGGPAAARAAGWTAGRWLVGAAGLGLAILTAGALLERGRFGAGQAPMLAGAVLSVSSALAWGVVVPVAAWQGSAGALSPWGP